MINKRILSVSVMLITSFLCACEVYPYWIWTPETKKFVNPKYAPKDSPKEQFDYAMGFYNSKDYKKAAAEFEKLIKHYEYSEFAANSQYYIGLCFENMGKLFVAYQNYQKALDNYPHNEKIDEIIAREFNIAGIYAGKANPKLMGVNIMTSLDRAAEIYKKVVENAPYGRFADEAQFNLGDTYKKAERFDEAIEAFQKVVDEYPSSPFAAKAKYESAYCAYRASLKPAYDSESTQKAIRAFQEFSKDEVGRDLVMEADDTVRRLKDKAAEKSLLSAQFYEKQKHYASAIIYYKDILEQYPESSFAELARKKIEELQKKVKK